MSEDTGTGQSHFNRMIAFSIVAVSILGALVTWRASVESQRAGGLDGSARQEQIREARVELRQRALVGMDLHVFALFEERQAQAARLTNDADRLGPSAPARARALGLEAQRQWLETETLARAFFVWNMVKEQPDGSYRYDTVGALRLVDPLGTDERGLDSAATRELAREAHSQASVYLAAALLLALVLLCLTLAQISDRRRGLAFAGAGASAFIVAGVLFFVG